MDHIRDTVLLLKAPRGRYSYFREGSESLALAYLAAFLRAAGKRVAIIDAQLEGLSFEATVERCRSASCDLVGFTIADPSFIPATYRLALAVKEMMPSVHLSTGGYAPTFHYKDILEQCSAFDSVVRHEGEQTLLELVEALECGADWHGIKGIAYRDGGNIVCNDPRPLMPDLDTLPFPARDYVPYIKEHLPDVGVVSVSGSRGCYANCGFCSIKRFYSEPGGATYRMRSVRSIADEMADISSRFGVDEFLLIDDIFTLPSDKSRERVEEWRRELAKRELRVMLSISDRLDHIHRPLYDAVYELGVRQIMVGVEATHPEILRYLNKNITLDDIRRAIGVLQDLGIDVTITYINFTPRTTLEILRDNLDCLLSLNVSFLLGLLNRLQVYVGTPVARDMMEAGMVSGTFPNFSYRIPDSRVEVVYEVCCQCFSPFLEVSYEVMKIERMFRLKQFRVEKIDGNPGEMVEARGWFGQSCRAIMEEAAQLFRMVLDYAERHDTVQEGFIGEMQGRAREAYRLWHRELLLHRDHSPIFDDKDRLLLR